MLSRTGGWLEWSERFQSCCRCLLSPFGDFLLKWKYARAWKQKPRVERQMPMRCFCFSFKVISSSATRCVCAFVCELRLEQKKKKKSIIHVNIDLWKMRRSHKRQSETCAFTRALRKRKKLFRQAKKKRHNRQARTHKRRVNAFYDTKNFRQLNSGWQSIFLVAFNAHSTRRRFQSGELIMMQFT